MSINIDIRRIDDIAHANFRADGFGAFIDSAQRYMAVFIYDASRYMFALSIENSTFSTTEIMSHLRYFSILDDQIGLRYDTLDFIGPEGRIFK